MRTLGKWLGRAVLALVLAAVVVGFWKREEITRLWAVQTLFDAGKIVENFSNMEAAFQTAPLPRGTGPVSALPKGATMTLPDGVDTWIADRAVTSLLVMKNGEVRFEEYYLGTGEDDRRISWSLAKSYLSSLFGILLEDGAITSIDDQVTQYVPSLKGTAYDGASIRNVLNMASGTVFDEDYLDNRSDIKRMGRVIALGGTLDDFTASFTETFAAPGEVWRYVSIDTHVLSMVIRGATGRTIPDLLAQHIVEPLGLEQDGYYVTDGAGTAFVLGGLNFTTRDFARFGKMISQGGQIGGRQVVPADWIAAATVPSAPTAPGDWQYGYFWWIPSDAHDGEFLAYGVYGQYIYFDTERDVMIVRTAADRLFREPGVHRGNVEMFRTIAQSL